MIIISDTSPLCYLILIDCIDILPKLYGNVIIPQAVYRELQAQATPELVKEWIQNYPDWFAVENINYSSAPELDKLDQGEKEAMILAKQINADLIILDDKHISMGKAARLLNINRWQLTELMSFYNLSPFPEQTQEELETEITETLQMPNNYV